MLSDNEIRLECLKLVLAHGTPVEKAVETSRPLAEFVLGGGKGQTSGAVNINLVGPQPSGEQLAQMATDIAGALSRSRAS